MSLRSLVLASAFLFALPVGAQQRAPQPHGRANPSLPAAAGARPKPPANQLRNRVPSPYSLILNGDFEKLSAGGCLFGLSNTAFNATVEDAFAFGAASELDVMNDPSGCNFGFPPPSGSTKLGVSSQAVGGPVDAFSLQLAQPLRVGRIYLLRFSSYAFVSGFSPDVVDLEIGLSSSPSSLGTPLLSVTPDASGFVNTLHFFVARAPATFLTITNDPSGDGWNQIDDFNLQEVDGRRTVSNGVPRSGLFVVGSSVRAGLSPTVGGVYSVLPFQSAALPNLTLPAELSGAPVYGQLVWLNGSGQPLLPGPPFVVRRYGTR